MEFLLGLGAGVWLGASLGVIVASILRTSKDHYIPQGGRHHVA
jgi:hypothetical protein